MPQHCDPDVLALLALGEHASTHEDEQHLMDCSRCQSELDQLRAVVTTGRRVTPEDQPQAPSELVWRRVAAEVGIPATPRHDPATSTSRGPARGGFSRRAVVLVASAAAVVGIAIGVGASGLLSGSEDGTDQVVASATLEPLPSKDGAGTARVVGNGSGRELDVDVSGLGPVDGYYEVWLLDADGKKLVSLGLLTGSSGRFVLPVDVDLASYPVVDISIEPVDGNPAHSGDSVVRGKLTI